MRTYVVGLSIAISMLLPMSGCSTPALNEVELGKEFTLAVGQSAAITGENLSIKFVEVVSDSRCPTGAVCIWAGEASCLIEITDSATTHQKVLIEPGVSSPARDSFNEYVLTFAILPYPDVGKQIDAKDYRLQLTVTKGPALNGGVLATFDVVGERYRIFITNEETIEQVFALQRGESQATIPSGRIIRGPVAYNQPWSWHIDPEDIEMAEMTIELCDGLPSHVEGDLDYWVDTVQRFCPWGAELVEIQDYR